MLLVTLQDTLKQILRNSRAPGNLQTEEFMIKPVSHLLVQLLKENCESVVVGCFAQRLRVERLQQLQTKCTNNYQDKEKILLIICIRNNTCYQDGWPGSHSQYPSCREQLHKS